MGESFDVTDPMVFTAGAVGEPGRRVFYLQAQAPGTVVTLKCEKQQVGALAEYLGDLLEDLPSPDPAGVPTILSLLEPLVPEWAVGSLAVAWDENADRLVLVAEELPLVDENAGPVGEESAPSDEEQTLARARFQLTREQVAAFVAHAREVIAGGRPPCPYCGRPLDPEGHACPRMN